MFNVKRKIHDKILVYIGGIILVILSILAVITFYMVRNYSLDNARELSTAAANDADDKMTYFFREVERLSHTLILQRAVYSANAEEMYDAFISNIIARKEYIQAIYLGTVSGKIFGRGIGNSYSNYIPQLPPDFDPRKRPWYIEALKNSSYVISKPYWFSGDINKGISLSTQVFHPVTKKLTGVLNIDFRVDVISKIISLLKVSRGGKAMLFNSEGNVIRLRLDRVLNETNQNITTRFNTAANEYILKHSGGTLITHSKDKKYMVSFKRNQKTGWILLIKIPYNNIMQEGFKTLRILNISYGILIIFVLIILHFRIKTILTPVIELTRGAQRVAHQDFDYRINIKDKNEIGILAATYNDMAAEIKRYTAELTEERNLLDKRVKERTKELKEAIDEMEKLNEIAKELSVSFEFDTVFQKISDYLFNVYGFEGCILSLLEEQRKSYRIDKVHSPLKNKKSFEKILGNTFSLQSENDLIAESIMNNRRIIVKQDDLKNKFNIEILQNSEIRTVAVMPLTIEKSVIGTFTLISYSPEIQLSDKDVDSIDRFVNQIAIVVRNSKLYEVIKGKNEELVVKDRIISQDLQTAKRIQQEVIHYDRDDTGELNFHVLFEPMIEVGGDIYDIIKLKEGYYRIFLADALGHGVQAALTTMLIKIEYDNVKYTLESPEKIITILNSRFVSRYLNLNVFFSGGLFDIDVYNKKLYYCPAGHPDNVIIKNGKVEILEGGGVVIGMSDNNGYEMKEIPFTTKDKVLLMTDGLYEEFSAAGKELELEGVLLLLEKHKTGSVDLIINSLYEDVLKWIGTGQINDDITAIGIEYFRHK